MDELGCQLIAIAPEAPAGLAKTREKTKANFALVGDSGTEALRAYGVGWQQQGKQALPAPAVFVVGADGTIAFHYVNPNFNPGLQHGKLPIALNPETRAQVIAAEDIGRFAVLLFEEHTKMNGVALDIAGDEKTMPETAEILGNALGRKIEFVRVPIEEIRKMSDDFAIMFEWADRVGYSVDIPGLADRTGIQPLTLAQWAAKLKRPGTTAS